MKKLIATVILLLVVSCKNGEKKETSDSVSDTEQIAVLDTLQLKFDNGGKWIANAETHEGMKQMDAIISAFKETNSKDYKALGDDLSKQTSYIIKNCSMKGEPHDQLHVVLVPMLDEVSILRDHHSDAKKSKAALAQLEQLITAYFKYFNV